MKALRLPTASATAIAIVSLLLFSNGCGKHSAPAPEGFSQSKSVTSANPTSFNDVAKYLDTGGSFYLYLSTEQWLNGLSGKISKWRSLFENFPMNAEEHNDVNKAFDVVTSIVHDSGLEDISGVGLSSIAIEKQLYRTRMVLHHYKGKGSGFGWTMFGTAPHALNGLDMAPATTAFAMFSDFDFAQLWSVIIDETKKSNFPQAQQIIDQAPAEFKKATGLDLNKTLQSLGAEYGVILTLDDSKMVTIPLPTSEPIEIPEPGLLIVAKADDATIFNRIDDLLTQTGMQVTKTEKADLKMRTVNVPVPVPFAVRPSIALAGGYLFIASNDGLIEEVLAVKSGAKPGLKSTDDFKRLSKDMPIQGNRFSYVSKRFGQTFMKVQEQVMELQSHEEPGVKELMREFINPANAQEGFSVVATTDEGWVMAMNGTQNGAAVAVLIPAVAVGGLLGAIAVPNFVKARETAQENTCINNLRMIEAAKEQWALEKPKNNGATPTESDLAPYLKYGMPTCPQHGEYTIGAVGSNPKCSIPGHSLGY